MAFLAGVPGDGQEVGHLGLAGKRQPGDLALGQVVNEAYHRSAVLRQPPRIEGDLPYLGAPLPKVLGQERAWAAIALHRYLFACQLQSAHGMHQVFRGVGFRRHDVNVYLVLPEHAGRFGTPGYHRQPVEGTQELLLAAHGGCGLHQGARADSRQQHHGMHRAAANVAHKFLDVGVVPEVNLLQSGRGIWYPTMTPYQGRHFIGHAGLDESEDPSIKGRGHGDSA